MKISTLYYEMLTYFRKRFERKLFETFHDNGEIKMADIMRVYKEDDIDIQIRIDHVTLMAGER